jgi:hypothetical protein
VSRRAIARGLFVVLAGCLLPSSASARCAARKVRHSHRPAAPAPVAAESAWPRPEVLAISLRAFECGWRAGLFDTPLLTVIDYSLPSTERRLWVIDVASHRVLFHELVAHGEGSGELFPVVFSNQPGSRRSSLGLFRTEDAYDGQHGRSLRLMGLEPGINDRAMERTIVIHGAAYVSRAVVSAHGRLGRSWGCPALDPAVHRRIIDRIKDGTAVLAYYPDSRWLQESKFLHCPARRSGDPS